MKPPGRRPIWAAVRAGEGCGRPRTVEQLRGSGPPDAAGGRGEAQTGAASGGSASGACGPRQEAGPPRPAGPPRRRRRGDVYKRQLHVLHGQHPPDKNGDCIGGKAELFPILPEEFFLQTGVLIITEVEIIPYQLPPCLPQHSQGEHSKAAGEGALFIAEIGVLLILPHGKPGVPFHQGVEAGVPVSYTHLLV